MPSILLIDDDESVCKLLRKMLESAGYLVRTAITGDQGLDSYREHGADLVITDIFMPDKDGIELVRELRSEAKEVPIIAISGGMEMMEPAMMLKVAASLGALYTLPKPLAKTELLDTVSTALQEAA